MSLALLSPEFHSVLKLQGLSTESYIGVFVGAKHLDLLKAAADDSIFIEFSEISELVRAARSGKHFVIACDVSKAPALVDAMGQDLSSTVAVIALGELNESGPSLASLRAAGLMAVLTEPDLVSVRSAMRRGLEFRALRSLELSHRCESQRLALRELDLMGHPPENMTDDLNSVQPPPLPVGPISPYHLDESSESFERAYIDRVQHLCGSAREAAIHLDVSAATLARRQRKDEDDE